MTAEHESEKGSARRNWVSLIPFGLHQQHPNNYKDILEAVWENRETSATPTASCATAVVTGAPSAPRACMTGP